MQVAGCRLRAAGNRFIYAAKIEFMQRKRFHFVSKQDLLFDLCGMFSPCHMPRATRCSCKNFPAPSRSLFHSLSLSLSNCKRCWRLKYLIQRLHDAKTSPFIIVYYATLPLSLYVCVSVCVRVRCFLASLADKMAGKANAI